MQQRKNRIVIALAALLLMAMTLMPLQTFAAGNEVNLTASQLKDGTYDLSFDSEAFETNNDIEFNTVYFDKMKVANTSGAPVVIQLIDVKSLLEDNKLYDATHLTIASNGVTLYDGPLNNARISVALKNGESTELVFGMSVPEKVRRPDNSWMDRKMHARYLFQCSWDNSQHNLGGKNRGRGSRNGSKPPTGDEPVWPALLVGGIGIALLVIFGVMSDHDFKEKKKKHPSDASEKSD